MQSWPRSQTATAAGAASASRARSRGEERQSAGPGQGTRSISTSRFQLFDFSPEKTSCYCLAGETLCLEDAVL